MFRWNLGYVYIVKANGLYKIGSSKTPHRRIGELRTASPFLEEVHHIPCLKHTEIEKYLHQLFHRKRVVREWFSLTDADLDWIAAYDWEMFPPERKARMEIMERYDAYKMDRKANPGTMERIRMEYAASKSAA